MKETLIKQQEQLQADEDWLKQSEEQMVSSKARCF